MLDRQLAQRTVQCTPCTNKHGVPPYVDLPVDTYRPAKSATYCPSCGKTRTLHPYDYADTLCQEYFGLKRQAAIQVIKLFNELRQSDNPRSTHTYTAHYDIGIASHPQQQVHAGTQVLVNELTTSHKAVSQAKAARDIYEYLDTRGIKRVLQRGYIAPLDCTCKSCGGQFTLLRGVVDTTRSTPIYCVWCGAKSTLITDPTQTEDTAWLVLSTTYSLPIPALKVFYDQWSTSTSTLASHPTFQSYMQSEEVQQLLPLLTAQSNPPSTVNPSA